MFLKIVRAVYAFSCKRWENAKDMKGNERGTQAGNNLNIFQNQFIGEMRKEAIRIQSYNNIKHENIVIAKMNLIMSHKACI